MRSRLIKNLSCPYHNSVDLDLINIESVGDSVISAILICPECGRWFCIVNEIPMLIKDELRLINTEIEFLKTHKSKIPAEIYESGKPLNLNNSGKNISPNEDEKKILLEGKYWGDFFSAYYEAGDFSIFDIRQKGLHLPFLTLGISERDERDKNREYGLYPKHLGRKIFPLMKSFKGKSGIDIGCGGGQFGIEAAYNGADVTGMDISFGAILAGSEYTHKMKLSNMNFLYASPDMPPFKPDSFDFILFKDSIHHFPDPDKSLAQLSAALKQNAPAIIYEHVSEPKFAKKIKDKISSILMPRIMKKYSASSPDPIFANIPPNEDAGMEKVVSAVEKYFEAEIKYGELRLYLDLDAMIYFAAGKRLWLSNFISNLIYCAERTTGIFSNPRHVLIIGKKKSH